MAYRTQRRSSLEHGDSSGAAPTTTPIVTLTPPNNKRGSLRRKSSRRSLTRSTSRHSLLSSHRSGSLRRLQLAAGSPPLLPTANRPDVDHHHAEVKDVPPAETLVVLSN
eukprot:CAMPEP_0168827876 /NCGR_PEP_ID=MMETSP0727-20121128/220_1 /TAXON_ID=265536 /ORGANISM="Amphiprora sp., Strain CCMP467" /LENGTH=108 /DNA_ID=CAMNT_0008881047 /DNA_START=192 /DNA_END=518 /DNA_ORIENTATION=-